MPTIERMNYSVTDLKDLVTRHRERIVKAHAKALRDYERKAKAVGPKVAAELRAAADRAAAGDLPPASTSYRHEMRVNVIEVPTSQRIPSKPEEGPDTWRLDQLLSALGKTTDTKITLSPRDVAQYMGEHE